MEFDGADRPSSLLPHPAVSTSARCYCSWGWQHTSGGQSCAGNQQELQRWCILALEHCFFWGHAAPQGETESSREETFPLQYTWLWGIFIFGELYL